MPLTCTVSTSSTDANVSGDRRIFAHGDHEQDRSQQCPEQSPRKRSFHGIAHVDDQIQEHLLDLARVRVHAT